MCHTVYPVTGPLTIHIDRSCRQLLTNRPIAHHTGMGAGQDYGIYKHVKHVTQTCQTRVVRHAPTLCELVSDQDGRFN